ncbi:hypothetical protein, partial [Shewanella colwelliana]|uniref:hypothetical protein n=1 Tax=Shewanella colwelliana TaxID=23 RepID=UPI001C7DCC53
LGLIIALAGIIAIGTLTFYRVRETQKLADDALMKVKKQLTPYTEALVADALDKVFVSEKLDTELEKVATDVEKRILTTLRDRATFSTTESNIQCGNTAHNLQSILQD